MNYILELVLNENILTENLKSLTQVDIDFLEQAFSLDGICKGSRRTEDYRFFPGKEMKATVTFSSHVSYSDIGSKIAKFGGHAVFQAAFKLLDMMVEWVAFPEGAPKKHTAFAEKIKISRQAKVPVLLESSPWLMDLVWSIFEKLSDFRNSVIHREITINTQGILEIKDRNGNLLKITGKQLVDLSDFAASVALITRGDRDLDGLEVTRIKVLANGLREFHGFPEFEVELAEFARVVYAVHDCDINLPIDLTGLRNIISKRRASLSSLVVCLEGAGQPLAWSLSAEIVNTLPNEIEMKDVKYFGVATHCDSAALRYFRKQEDFG